MRRLVAALALLSGAAAALGEEWSRPHFGWLPGTQPPGWDATLVIDAGTHAPVAGAEARRFQENVFPLVLGAPLLARGTTDEFGAVALPMRDRAGEHWVVEKPGYGFRAWYGDPEPTTALPEAKSGRGRLLDWTGSPLAGARVELFVNCPHGPRVRRTVTAADGTFAFDGVGGLDDTPMSLATPSVRGRGGEWIEASWCFEDPPPTIVAGPPTRFEGVVVDPAGGGVAGCVVRGARWYDVATSALDGSLRLDGVAPDGALRFYHPAWLDGAEPFVQLDGFEPGVPVRVGFPPSATETRTVRVRVVEAATGRPVPDVLVRAVERASGIVRFGSTERAGGPEPEGECVLRLRPGPHRLLAGSGLARFHGESAVDAEALAEIAVAERTARAEIEGAPEEAALALVSATEEIDARSEDARVPDADPVYVRAHFEGTEAVAPLGPLRDGVRRARFEWRRRPPAATPPEPGPERDLRVLLPDGADAPLDTVWTESEWDVERDEELGWFRSAAFRPGERVVATLEGYAPLARTLEGDGPYTLRWGTARLEFDVRCEAGEPLDFVLYLDGAVVKGAAAFDGVHPGPHLVWVAAADHVGRAMRLVLRDGETRRFALALPPR